MQRNTQLHNIHSVNPECPLSSSSSFSSFYSLLPTKSSSSTDITHTFLLRRVQPPLLLSSTDSVSAALPLWHARLVRSTWQILQLGPSSPAVPPSAQHLSAALLSSSNSSNRAKSRTYTSVSSSVPLSALFFPQTTPELTMWVYACGSIFPIRLVAEKKIFVDCADPSPSFLLTETQLQALHSSSNNNNTPTNTPLNTSIFTHTAYDSANTPVRFVLPFIRAVRPSNAVLPHGIRSHFLFEITLDPASTPDKWMPF